MARPDIEKSVLLAAPIARVWAAIADARAFGAWFGVEIEGPFVVGREAVGRIVPTEVDPQVAKLQEPHRGKPWRVLIDRIEPPRLFVFRWHPFAIDPTEDYSAEPMTLVTFSLVEEAGGTRLTITETGFEHIPAARRADALKANDGGWTHQVRLIETYVAHHG